MRHSVSIVSALLLTCLAAGLVSAQDVVPHADGRALDATLESIQGGQRRLGDERGRRVIVLFYEDRPHLEDNDALKRSLSQWIETNDLEDQVVAIGAANLLRIPGIIPHFLVRNKIRPLATRWNVDILLDWNGLMRQDPWPMQGNCSNVAILDRRGRLVWHSTGPLDPTQRRAFFQTLRRFLQH